MDSFQRYDLKYFGWGVLIWIVSIILVGNFGSQIPGDFWERNSVYHADLYVDAYPGAQKTKSYRVPARILCEGRGTYYLEYIWLQGDAVPFEDARIKTSGMQIVRDRSGREWSIAMTKEMIK